MTRRIETRLAALDPEWILDASRRVVGMRFLCPVDDGDGPHREGHCVAVLFANPPDGGRPHPNDAGMLGNNRGARWTRDADILELMTLVPSVDCTEHDQHCWHGHVVDGMIR